MTTLLYLVSCVLVSAFAQVPPQDECQFVNATEPPECPQTIGPPCPPCVVNEAADYQTGDPLTIDEETRDSIESYMNQYLEYWPKTYPPNKDVHGASIVEGAAGRALIFARLFNYTKNETYLSMAQEYINGALKEVNVGRQYPSYFAGRTGVYIVAAQIAKFQGNTDNVNAYLGQVRNVFEDVQNAINTNSSSSKMYGLDMTDGCIMTGLGGLLYSGMLVNEYFGANTVNHGYIANLTYYLIAIGQDLASQFNEDFLVYKFNYDSSCFLPGSAEGNGGVIKMMMEAYSRGYVPELFSNDAYKVPIQNTLNWFLSIQLADGNIPTYSSNEDATCGSVYGNDSDARVQWCHGAPGFIDTLSLAAVVFDGIGDDTSAEKYLNAALRAFNSTWERGLLIKGLMHCHGIGGNTYTLLHIYKNLLIISQRNSILNVKYNVDFLMKQSMWRAIQFVKFTVSEQNLNVLRTEYSNMDYSFWLGSYGIPVLYIQAIQAGWPQSEPVCMIAYDFCGV